MTVGTKHNLSNYLKKVLLCSRFAAAPRQSQLLRYLVEKTIEGKSDQIKAYSIAVDIFKRDEDFSSSIDPIVRIQIGRLRRSLQLYYTEEGKEDEIIISIPKGNYVPSILDRDNSISNSDIANEKTAEQSGDMKRNKRHVRIVILPFNDNTQDSSLDYMVDALGEELSSGFSLFNDLEVISYISSVQIKKENINPLKLYSRFGIDFMLSGTVTCTNNNCNIQVTLTNTKNLVQLWSHKYKKTLKDDDFPDLITQISKSVLGKIGGNYGVISRALFSPFYDKNARSRNVREALFHYKQVLMNPDMGSIEKIKERMKDAVENEPDFAYGWATLAEMNADLVYFDLPNRHVHLKAADAAINKALQIDPNFQHIQTTTAFICTLNKDIKGALAAARQAILINPNDAYHCGLAGFWIAVCGEYKEGASIIKASIDLNPYYPKWLHFADYLYALSQNDFEETLKQAFLFNVPGFYWTYILQTAILGLLRNEKAANSLAQLLELQPDFENQPREYLAIYFLDKMMEDKMMKGLKLAGLKV